MRQKRSNDTTRSFEDERKWQPEERDVRRKKEEKKSKKAKRCGLLGALHF